ncbi:MFS transporter [Marinobacterium aestuariivivens]
MAEFPSELFLPFLKTDNGTPRYRSLFRAFQQAILRGDLAAGARLPASRALCSALGVSRNTVKTAYEMLQAEGYIETRHGAGSFVSGQLPDVELRSGQADRLRGGREGPVRMSAMAARLPPPERLYERSESELLAPARPCLESFPWAQWQRAVSRAARRMRHEADARTMGCEALRGEIARYLQVVRGVRCEPRQLMICAGSQQALVLALQLLLDPGDPVLVEEPGYAGIDGAIAAIGAQRVAVAADEEGFRLQDALAKAPGARLALLTPSRNYPMGYTLSLQRRLELLSWATETGSWLIEDDYDSEFRYDGPPLTSLQGLGGEERVLYAGTFSRILHPSIRLGYLVRRRRWSSLSTTPGATSTAACRCCRNWRWPSSWPPVISPVMCGACANSTGSAATFSTPGSRRCLATAWKLCRPTAACIRYSCCGKPFPTSSCAGRCGPGGWEYGRSRAITGIRRGCRASSSALPATGRRRSSADSGSCTGRCGAAVPRFDGSGAAAGRCSHWIVFALGVILFFAKPRILRDKAPAVQRLTRQGTARSRTRAPSVRWAGRNNNKVYWRENAVKTVDVHKIIDEARFNQFHWLVLFWTGLIIIFDGYDLIIYGVVLPKLMAEWKLSPVDAGTLGSTALFGMMFGALLFGQLSDRIGRKKTIMICVALFSGVTFLNGFARDPMEFGLCRFVAGLGIGGVMPNTVALMTEYAPKKLRSTLVAIMFSGYSIGGMASAFVGMHLIPAHGWPSVFFIAGIPVLLLPLIWLLLPESIGYLVQSGRTDEAARLLNRVDPRCRAMPDDRLLLPETGEARGGSLLTLFSSGRLLSTLMFWLSFFCCLMMVYALASWLPKIMEAAGYEVKKGLLFLLVLNLGAMFGAIGGGWMADRFHLRRVITIMFVAAALSIGLLGLLRGSMTVQYLLIAIAGACTIGTQILLYAYVAQYYPQSSRSTGIGWASGVGRLGAILGPILGGVLMAAQLDVEMNFIAVGVPAIIAALAISMVGRRARPAVDGRLVADGAAS